MQNFKPNFKTSDINMPPGKVAAVTRALLVLSSAVVANGFVLRSQPLTSSRTSQDSHCSLASASIASEADEAALQWELFNKHHAKGSWKGIWTTYDFIGDVMDETVASVDLIPKGQDKIEHTHTIVVGAKRSDCATCFDSMETKTLPVATYTPTDLRKSRFAACSMVSGPSLLRSGTMATELILNHGDGRVRVIFQHAPVWEQVSSSVDGKRSLFYLLRWTLNEIFQHSRVLSLGLVHHKD